MIARILLCFLASLLALPISQATEPAKAGKKFKIVTRAFSNNAQIAIPDSGTMGPANPYPSTIGVSGFKRAKIKDVNLILHDFSHTAPIDVDVMVVAANDRNGVVMGAAGWFHDVSGITLTLDEQAGVALPGGDALTSGTFQPRDFSAGDPFPDPAPIPSATGLSVFNGGNPNGAWTLFVVDNLTTNSGSLDSGWTLEITARVKKKKR